ncbi:MAG: efflux RND transporter permease subunit [Alphaproteobacteria bacterium]|nr:efflux RND transporter permease subunit [Alphaproteobacteria bacterium]
MKSLFSRPLLWLLIYGALAAYGVHALFVTPAEVLPRFDFPQISIVAHRPGATATGLETEIVRPLEGRILALPDVSSVRSVMGSGAVEIDVRFRPDTPSAADLLAVNGAIDRARAELPPDARPQANIMGNAVNEVADYAAVIPAAVAPADAENAIRANVVPALRALSGVQRVEVYGAGREALWIQPDLAAMHRYNISIPAIMRALKKFVVTVSGGYVSAGHQDIPIEIQNWPRHIRELASIPVMNAQGRMIPLGSVTRIVRAGVPTHNAVLLDGHPAVALTILKQPDAGTLLVTRAVQKTLTGTAGALPKGVKWVRIYDQGYLVHLIGRDLGRNLVVGGFLAVGALLLAFGAGRGVWLLALSIPMSLLMGVALLHAAGQSLNLITLGAITVAVGLLADDAIIVLDSIQHRRERGAGREESVAEGLRDIASPDVTGTLTTVSVFLPLLAVGGLAGLFFIPFALAMAFTLLASLFVSLTLIPLGLSFIKTRDMENEGVLLPKLRHLNKKLFYAVVRRPRLSLFACVAFLFASLAGLAFVPVNFLPLPNEGVLLESFTLPPGTSLADTRAAVDHITRKLKSDPVVDHVYARIGSASDTAYTEPAYAGEIQITLKSGVDVNNLDAISERLLKESRMMDVQAGIDTPTIERTGESLSGLPQPFVLRIFGNSIMGLRKLATKISARLRGVPGLADVFNNDAYPVSTLQVKPDIAALAAAHFTPADLNAQIRPLLHGETAALVPSGNVPLAIYVRLAGATQKSPLALAQLPINTPRGWTPLGGLAKLKLVSRPNLIRHLDGARMLDILATPTAPLSSVIAAAKRALSGISLPQGYRIAFGGLYPELEQAALSLAAALVAALALMAGIMTLQFEGFLVPGLLLLQMPLALTGGAAALVVSGVGLNATGLIAFLTLVGVSLNHGIVLLYRARCNEKDGMDVKSAVEEAVRVRLRPIVLTTTTAVLGMLPTALGLGAGAAPEQGLAVVIMGGVIWSALLSTNLIPALYLARRLK